MPTDENNLNPTGQNQTQPQINDSNVQKDDTSFDDFDFNFNSDTEEIPSTNAGNGLSSTSQEQLQRQGRSGLFLTPDEEMERANMSVDDDMDLSKMDLSKNQQPQGRSGIFLTPDEEAKKEDSLREGENYKFQGNTMETQNEGNTSDDDYLAGIDPNDFDDNSEQLDVVKTDESDTENDGKTVALDSELQDFLSFDDMDFSKSGQSVAEQSAAEQPAVEQPTAEQPAEEQPAVEQPAVEQSAAEQPAVEQSIAEQPAVEQPEIEQPAVEQPAVEQPAEEQPAVEQSVVEQPVAEQPVQDNQSDDAWLLQEDKKVEEDLGVKDSDNNMKISENVDESIEDKVQSVENIITDEILASNDLHIENLGADVVENSEGDLVSDTGNVEIKPESYVPNENDFVKMSNLLNSSDVGQVDLNKEISTENNEINNIIEAPESNNINLDDLIQNTPVNNIASENQVENIDNQVNQISDVNTVNTENLSTMESHNTGDSNEQIQINLENTENPSTNVEMAQNITNEQGQENVSGINIDKLSSDIAGVQNIVNENNVENSNVQVMNTDNLNQQNDVQQNNVQQIPTKIEKVKNSKKILFVVIGLAVICLIVFVFSKMYPDVFNDIMPKKGISIDYSDNSGKVADLSPSESIDENLESEEPLDPNSIAGMIAENEQMIAENEQMIAEDEQRIAEDEQMIAEDEQMIAEDGQMIAEDGQNMEEKNHGSAGDIDVFGGLDEVLDPIVETKNKINEYLEIAQEYYDKGTEKGNNKLMNYSDYIKKNATNLLSAIENGDEINTSELFSNFDSLIQRMEKELEL